MNNTPSDSLYNSILFLYVRFFSVIVFEELLFIHHIEFAFYDILCLKRVERREVGYSQHGASDKLHLMCSFVVIYIGGRAYGAGLASIVAWPTTFLLPYLFFFHFILNTFRHWMHIWLSFSTRISHPWQTRATRCIMANVLQTNKVDAECDKLATNLSWQCVASKVTNVHLPHLHLTYSICIWRLHWGWPRLSLPRFSASGN